MKEKYDLRYDFAVSNNNGNGWKKEDIQEQYAYADAIVGFSILRYPDATSILMIANNNGKNNNCYELDNNELFDIFTCLADRFSEADDIPKWKREIARNAIEKIRENTSSESHSHIYFGAKWD